MKGQRSFFNIIWVCLGLIILVAVPMVYRTGDQGDRTTSHSAPERKPAAHHVRPVDCSTKACMALTFDDGPHKTLTPRILDILAYKKVKATFFVLGVNVVAHPDIVQRIHQEGHEVGNHSWNHANMTTLTPAQIDEQVSSTQMAIAAAGVPAPQWFRPPYGAMNAQVRAHVPLRLALWNVDPEDWAKRDPQHIIEHVKAHAGHGRVVDLHDPHPATADALPAVIDALQSHYQLVTMTQLFEAVPGSRGEYYGR